MTTTAASPNAATPAQLRYLKRLAEQAGQTVTLPRSRLQASALIGQLRDAISKGGGAAEREAEAARDCEAVRSICPPLTITELHARPHGWTLARANCAIERTPRPVHTTS